jgi:C4-dicarboxylate-specific signal transduction histidine kinase
MGLPGRVWSSGGPVCIRDVALDPELPRAKSAAKEGLHAAFAFPVMLKSGIVGVIELFSRVVRDADRGLLQMMAAIGSQVAQFIERTRAEDALRDAREKLAQASKIASLAELSASIAHEINQPLQAIVANGHASLRWLDAAPPNIEKAISTAKRVVRDGNAAAEVVSRIRALFQHAAPAKIDLDINKLILQVGTLMADEIQGTAVSLEAELGEDVPRIRADAVQIQQVIVNLVRNAIEAMAGARRKPLLIRSRRSASHVVVDVRDQGTGLVDPEKIFEPFVSTKGTGMGMGLTICRSIIEAHGGDIRVMHNEGPGVTFSFSLPLEASDAT